MISMLRLVLSLPPPPQPSLRQPVVRTARAPRGAPAVKVDLLIMCTPSDTGLVGTRICSAAVRRGKSGQAGASLRSARGLPGVGVSGDAAAVRGREDVRLLGR